MTSPSTLPDLETFPILEGEFQFTCSKFDENLTEFVRKEKCWEPWNTRIIRERVRQGMDVADVGSGWGYFLLIFSKLVGPNKCVVGFEPNPISRSILRKNMDQNQVTNYFVVPCAISNFDGTAKMHYRDNDLGSSSIQDHTGTPERGSVTVHRLDELFHRPLDFVKIDAEGADFKVLEGMRNIIARSPNIKMVCEYIPAFHKGTEGEPFDIIDSLGLNYFYVHPSGDLETHPREWFTQGGGATLFLEHKT